MIKKYLKLLPLLLILLSQLALAQQENHWSRIDAAKVRNSLVQRKAKVDKYAGFALNRTALTRDLENVPNRRSATSGSGRLMKFPDKDGKMITFRVMESSVMEPGLASKYPNNKSYVGASTDGTHKRIRFSVNAMGFNAIIMGPDHTIQFIEPLTKDKMNYRIYDRNELEVENDFTCLIDELGVDNSKLNLNKGVDDLVLRTYRLAVAATGEYSEFHIDREGVSGGTDAEKKQVVMAEITTAITRINAVYENDLAISLEIISNNDEIIYLDPDTDPYSNDDGSAMLGENQANLDNVIGTANYDVGHVFSTGGGGVATRGSACVSGAKAGGVTGLSFPTGDNFYFDYVAHEFGHQFGANHTFNSTTGDSTSDCSTFRNDPTAVEPGSGSTLMAYASLCSPQNVQEHSDLYFHIVSIEEIFENISQGSSTCAAETSLVLNKSAPVSDAGPDYIIPVGTPFVLRGSGSDADNDPLSYCWEQIDNQITAVPPSGNSTGGALYRSLTPVTESERYFPELKTLAKGEISSTWEVTPLVARELNFKLTVRDNNVEAGQSDADDLKLTVSDAAGPFVVTSQSIEGSVLTPGAQESVTWDVAGTNANGINVSTVNIRLSTDDGQSFPVVLASNVQNDGEQSVSLPEAKGAKCFIMVEAVGNVFLALNSQPFSIGEFNEICNETSATDTPIDIPDNDLAGIVSEIEISESVLIEDLSLNINDLSHTWVGDLDITLESPSGTLVKILSGACDGFENILDATFTDAGDDVICNPTSPAITGNVKPLQELSEFIGESTLGIWKLRVFDDANDDIGKLNDWSLEICSLEAVLAVNNYVFDNFKIFPNPSDGRFRIQFNSENTADVEISVYDLLGRKIANRVFKNSFTAFDEEINLYSIRSGLYILRVKRGNNISSQKITIE